MNNREKNAISEAKKAPLKVPLGTEAFLASERTLISPLSAPAAIRPAPPGRSQIELIRQSETQLISRADASLGLPTLNEAAGAARLNCYTALFTERNFA